MTPTREEIIDELWANSAHGTLRQDIEAAFKAGQDAEAKRAFEEGFVTTGAMRDAVLKEREVCEHAAAVAISLFADPVAAIRARSET